MVHVRLILSNQLNEGTKNLAKQTVTKHITGVAAGGMQRMQYFALANSDTCDTTVFSK